MKEIDDLFADQAKKNAEGTLTIGESLINNYYRLKDGNYKDRIVIRTCAKIDDQSVCFFADSLTWIATDKIKNVRCQIVRPEFYPEQVLTEEERNAWWDDYEKEIKEKDGL